MKARAAAALPAQDLERARRWYAEKLGLTPVDAGGGLLFEMAEGTTFIVFMSSGKPSGDHTQLGLTVDDVEQTVAELRGRGVRFEQYEAEGFKTVNDIVEVEGRKNAWFKDSEGNLIVIGPPVRVGARR
jgi:catechol 2,3-dioxygenase-like lactoylglutathione lyase family enzyme